MTATTGWKALHQERAELKQEQRELFAKAEREGRTFAEDEGKRDDAIEARLGAIDAMLAREQRMRQREADLPAVQIAEPEDEDAPVAAKAVRTPKLFGSFGEQLQAIYRAGVGQGTDERLLKLNAAAAGAGEAVGADGGFLVQMDMAEGILQRLYEQGELIRRVQRIPIGPNANGITLLATKESSRATGSRFGGVQGYWVDEGTAPTNTQPKFRKMKLELKTLAALGYTTNELLADAATLGAVMTQAFADELAFLTEDSFINGTGAGQPQGILNATCLVSVSKETGQSATTIVAENISKMWARCWARSRRNAVWLINQDIEPQLDSLALNVGTGGVPVYLPANGLSGAPFATLKGRPVIPVEYCATLGTVGDIILADLSQYAMIDKGGVQQAASMHVRFTTNEMAFRAIYRVDGQPIWEAALTPFKGTANTLSPFVALATRS